MSFHTFTCWKIVLNGSSILDMIYFCWFTQIFISNGTCYNYINVLYMFCLYCLLLQFLLLLLKLFLVVWKRDLGYKNSIYNRLWFRRAKSNATRDSSYTYGMYIDDDVIGRIKLVEF